MGARGTQKWWSGPGGVVPLVVLAAPLVVSYACDMVVLFTDRMFLSRLGTVHMSAALAGGLTSYTLTTLFVGVIGYSTSMVAQRLGAGNERGCAQVTAQALWVALGAWPLLVAAIPLGWIAFRIAGIDAAQCALQDDYFAILMGGTGVSLVRSALAAFFSGIGKTRLVMGASLLTMVTNVVFNYGLIFGRWGLPALGITGAAIGSVAAGAVGVAVLAVSYWGPRTDRRFATRSQWRPNRELWRELWRFGSFSGVELFLNLVTFNAMVFAFHAAGPVVAAATTIALNWDMVSFIPLLGINVGVTSLVGRHAGADDLSAARRTVRSGLGVALVYAGVLLAVFVSCAHGLVAVFAPEGTAAQWHQVAPLAAFMVQWIAVYLAADAVTVVFSGALRGVGDTFWTMVLSVAVHVLLAAEAWVGLHLWSASVRALWPVVVATVWLLGLVLAARYAVSDWKGRARAVARRAAGGAKNC